MLTVSWADITSNARVKEYPLFSELQVASDYIFREPGYEPCKRLYDVPPKGEAIDPERSKLSSRIRAKAAVRDIALCNQFDYFFTFTLSSEFVNRYDPVEVGKKVQTFLKNASYRKNFQYVCVPELHKDGAIHFHGLCKLGNVKIERAIYHRTGIPLSTNRGQPIFNMVDWGLGYSTCIPLDENYETACNYIVKYLSKGCDKILGKWYLASRSLVKRPNISIVDGGTCFDEFLEDNPDAPVVPVYRDVRMAIKRLSLESGDAV